MKSITKASRINASTQVIQNMFSGMTVVDACQEVGMPRSTFYYMVDNNPEAIASIQAVIDITNREQLGLILEHRLEILEKIIQDGLSEKTSPRARLAIYMKLMKLTDDLMDSLQREDGRDIDFQLTGPKLIQIESRFASR
jgi:hypothetical protein